MTKKQVGIFDQLSYGTDGRDKKWQIKEGEYKGKVLTFKRVNSYDGDIDQIVMVNNKKKEFIFTKNVKMVEKD